MRWMLAAGSVVLGTTGLISQIQLAARRRVGWLFGCAAAVAGTVYDGVTWQFGWWLLTIPAVVISARAWHTWGGAAGAGGEEHPPGPVTGAVITGPAEGLGPGPHNTR